MTTSLKGEVISTTLHDIVRIKPRTSSTGIGHKLIDKISKQTTKDDLKYIFFFFHEGVWLIDNDSFNAASISMISMIENALRNEYYARVKDKKYSNKEIEGEFGLGKLRDELKPYISNDAYIALIELNKLRKLLVHKNMEEGKKRVMRNKRIICPESLLGGGSVQSREVTRTFVTLDMHSYALRVFWLSLTVIKELYPEHKKNISGGNLDKLVQDSLNLDANPVVYW